MEEDWFCKFWACVYVFALVANPDSEEEPVLSEEFLRNCVDMFSVSPISTESNLRTFPKKNLNIIDPLKENNNLGRSVNRGR